MQALRLCLLLAAACVSVAGQETHAYRSLWGGLFRQQAGGAPHESSLAALAGDWRQALADVQAWLHPPADGATDAAAPAAAASPQTSQRASLADALAHAGNLTAALLDRSSGGGDAKPSLLARLHEHLAGELNRTGLDAQQLAAVAAAHSLSLAALLAASGAGLGGRGSAGSLDPLAFKQVPDPAWGAFKPSGPCLRLQNFCNAEGFNAALLGACAAHPGAPAPAAASSDALRWVSAASFLLDCSRGGASAMADGATAAWGASSGMLTAALHKAASKAADRVGAALDRSSTCRLALTSGGGGGAQLESTFERGALLGSAWPDALRVRLCNMPPSTLQYPAALSAGGGTVTLSSLKVNGRPLLAQPLRATQAAAAGDGCTAQLYRLPSRLTHAGFVLTGWVQLAEGGGGGGGGSGAPGGFGVGAMSSLEVSLGEYSALDAAASRLLGTVVAAATPRKA